MPVDVLLDVDIEVALPLLLDDELELDSWPPAPVVDDALVGEDVPPDVVDAVLMTASLHAKGESEKHRTLTTIATGRSVLCFIEPIYLSREGRRSDPRAVSRSQKIG